MTETVNYTTGEIATVDTSSEVAVTGYLQQARDWLATAVESTGPEQIAAAKAEIATAAEATKQLGLSKEIREDSTEMVRRAEYTLRKAVTKAQVDGVVTTRGDNKSPGGDKPSPESFFGSRKEWQDANAMANLDAGDFDEVIAEARAEGNLSRSNVAEKAREKSGTHRARPSRPAEATLNLIESLADKAARETQKLTADQIRRVKPNAAEWIGGLRTSVETLQGLLAALEQKD